MSNVEQNQSESTFNLDKFRHMPKTSVELRTFATDTIAEFQKKSQTARLRY